MYKLVAEFGKTVTLNEFDKKIDELVQTFPPSMSVMVKIKREGSKTIAMLAQNSDSRSIVRKEWDLSEV